ncbi:MAG: putative component of type VI protein secretion system [Planctomycetota bacterium]|jgi:predicted component of type VI protein secretion system
MLSLTSSSRKALLGLCTLAMTRLCAMLTLLLASGCSTTTSEQPPTKAKVEVHFAQELLPAEWHEATVLNAKSFAR